jgi:hypothetical protein
MEGGRRVSRRTSGRHGRQPRLAKPASRPLVVVMHAAQSPSGQQAAGRFVHTVLSEAPAPARAFRSMEMINDVARERGGFSVFSGAGERTREGNDLLRARDQHGRGIGRGISGRSPTTLPIRTGSRAGKANSVTVARCRPAGARCGPAVPRCGPAVPRCGPAGARCGPGAARRLF